MSILTEYEYYRLTYTNEQKQILLNRIQQGISNNDVYSDWYRNITPLQLHLYDSGLRINDNSDNFNNVIAINTYRIETIFIETTADFYPCYMIAGKKYCKAYLYETPSNLGIWTVCLSGDDDYSCSFDIIGQTEAFEYWNQLKMANIIHIEMISNYYFTN